MKQKFELAWYPKNKSGEIHREGYKMVVAGEEGIREIYTEEVLSKEEMRALLSSDKPIQLKGIDGRVVIRKLIRRKR